MAHADQSIELPSFYALLSSACRLPGFPACADQPRVVSHPPAGGPLRGGEAGAAALTAGNASDQHKDVFSTTVALFWLYCNMPVAVQTHHNTAPQRHAVVSTLPKAASFGSRWLFRRPAATVDSYWCDMLLLVVLQAEFEALRQAGSAPAMFIATPYDLHTSRW